MKTSMGIKLTGIPGSVRGGGTQARRVRARPAGTSVTKASIPGVRMREAIRARKAEARARLEELRATGDEWLAREADFWEGLEGRKQ